VNLKIAKTTFENLRVYQLSENLADKIWDIVIGWDNFAKDTVGKQIVRSADSVEQILLKAKDAAVFKTIVVL